MEFDGEWVPRLVGLSPSRDSAGVSQSHSVLLQQHSHITTCFTNHAMEAQRQLQAMRGGMVQLSGRRDSRPGVGGPACTGERSSHAGLSRERHYQGGLHGRSDT